MMQHYQHNKRTQIFLLCCFTSLLQIQIFKEHHSEERLVNARWEWSININHSHMTSPGIFTHQLFGLDDGFRVAYLCTWAEGIVQAGQLVELRGIEPRTSCVQGRRSPSWAIAPFYWSFSCYSASPEAPTVGALVARSVTYMSMLPRSLRRAPCPTRKILRKKPSRT